MAEHFESSKDADGCWEEIAAETGFASYVEYLETYEHESRFAQDVLWRKKIEDRSFGSEDLAPFSCSIIDLSKDVDSAITINTNHFEGGNATAADVLGAIRQPPRNSCARILLWSIEPRGRSARILQSRFLDVCGLGLRVGPEFFAAVAHRETRPFFPSVIKLCGKVATIARDYMPSQETPPVLLIADDFVPFLDEDMATKIYEIDDMWSSWAYKDLDRVPPFRPPPQAESQHGATADQLLSSGNEYCKTYVKCLNHLISHKEAAADKDADLSLLSMLPLLHLQALFLHRKSKLVRSVYINPKKFSTRDILDASSYFTTKRFHLRRHIEDFEADRIQLINYACGHQQDIWSKDSICRRVDRLWKDSVRDARLIETEIRDNMQLLAGQSSLEESKKSIEISNYQIQEGKRVNILTILAFIYAPLNTATSIYGMNIQQINSSGHNIGAFIITAVIVLLTTAISWLTMEEINQTKAWQKENARTDRSKFDLLDHKNHSRIGVRIFMMWWLIVHGHLTWAWKSNALSQILIGSASPINLLAKHKPVGIPIEQQSACVYVAYYMGKWSSGTRYYAGHPEQDPFSLAVVDGEKDSESG